MKKIFSVIALAAACGIVQQANAIEFNEGIFHFVTVSDEYTDVKASLVPGATVPKDVVIPTEVVYLGTTYTVTDLDGWMFSKNETIETVKMPERLTTLGWAVFEYCTNLRSCPLPESLVYIGNYCFTGCSSLNDVVIPQNVWYIGQDAFSWGGPIADEMILPDALTELQFNAFGGSKIKKMVFGKGLKESPQGCLAWDGALTEVVIPHNITTIMPYAFQGCGFSHVNVGAPEVIAVNAFESCANVTEIEVETTTPPICVEQSFSPDMYKATLIVPDEECIAAYKADAVWGKFAAFRASEAGSIESVAADTTVDGKVYSMQGIKVADDIKDVTIPGIYVSGGKKIVIRR